MCSFAFIEGLQTVLIIMPKPTLSTFKLQLHHSQICSTNFYDFWKNWLWSSDLPIFWCPSLTKTVGYPSLVPFECIQGKKPWEINEFTASIVKSLTCEGYGVVGNFNEEKSVQASTFEPNATNNIGRGHVDASYAISPGPLAPPEPKIRPQYRFC